MAFNPRLPALLLCGPALLWLGRLAAQQPSSLSIPSDKYKIQVSVNSVLVPVVVRDSHGHAVGNLTKEDFQLFDKNKKQTITGFTVERRAAPASDVASTEPQSTTGAETSNAPQPQRPSAPHFIVFLFDDLHLTASDLVPLKKAATKILDETVRSGDSASVLSILGRADSGVTTDRARLADAVANIRAIQSPYRLDPHACPNVDLYHADHIENLNDKRVFDVAVDDTLECAHLDPNSQRPMAEKLTHEAAQRTLALGEQDVRLSYIYVREIVRKMGALPGQRTLILISPGFYTEMPEALILQSQVLDAAARANVTISTLDARGLYTTAPKAEEEFSGFQNQTTERIRSHVESTTSMDAVMAALSDGTGGSFFHNSNDIEGGLRRLSAAPEYVYLLEFSLDQAKLDGNYHPLKVKVDRSDVQVQSRHGYFAPKTVKQKALLDEAASLPSTQTQATTQTPPALPPSPGPESSATTQPSEKQQFSPGSPPSVTSDQSDASPSAAASQVSTTETQPSASSTSAVAGKSPSNPSSSATEQLSPLAPSPSPLPANPAEKKSKDKALYWNPPSGDAHLSSRSGTVECDLPKVLAQAGSRATELVTNLQNFTAQEHIVYRVLGGGNEQLGSGIGDFYYTAALEHHKQGFAVRESRTPERGTRTFAPAANDIGLPEMALIFLPDFQDNYEMKCEGATEWNGQQAWIVQLRQRNDRPDRTASFSATNGTVYPAALKGHAWIARDSGGVIHLEVALIRPILPINVMEWFLSIDYAPVQFRTGNLRIWLPQYAETYGNYGTRRTIASHRFSDFLLFSVRTDQIIARPKSP